MWPFNRSRKALDDAALALVDRVAALEKVTRRLCDDVEELDQRYTKLRGLVYAKKLHKAPAEEEPAVDEPSQQKSIEQMTRAELKAHLTRSGRFLPGQPPKHSE